MNPLDVNFDLSSVSPAIAERLRRFSGPMIPLMSDLFLIRLKMEENDVPQQTGFWRRNYVRALFAYIEAQIFSMKLLVLKAHENGTVRISLADEVLLREQSFHIDRKGASRIVPKFVTFEESLKLTFRCHAAVRNPAFVLDTSGPGWDAFKRAVKIRHRVTHPKRLGDVEITSRDMADLEHAEDWFGEMEGRIAFPNSNITRPEVRIAIWQLVTERADEWSSLLECTPEELKEQMRLRIAKEKSVVKARAGNARKAPK